MIVVAAKKLYFFRIECKLTQKMNQLSPKLEEDWSQIDTMTFEIFFLLRECFIKIFFFETDSEQMHTSICDYKSV